MAHKKGEGSTQNGRDSRSKRLGVKLFGGQLAIPGNIIVRQRGTRYNPGAGVGIGKDHTLYALREGIVEYRRKMNDRTYVNVVPFEPVAETIAPAPEAEKPAKKAAAKKTETVVETPAPVMETPAPVAETATGSDIKPDNLKVVEGIGPKIEQLLNAAGITTFAELAMADAAQIKEILTNAGPRYRIHDPSTWPQQAALAAAGKWDELKQLQDELVGGKEAEEDGE